MSKIYPQSRLLPQLWGTVGVEIETAFRNRQEVMGDIGFYGPYDRDDNGKPKKEGSPISQVYRDASVEGKFASLNGFGVYLGKKAVRNILSMASYVGGSEVITLPLSYDIADEVVASILSALEAGGEQFSPRTSIHFHFGFPKHLAALKRILALGIRVETLLYRLAGLGKPYRGSINKSVYARPLLSKTAVYDGDGKFAIINPSEALTARTETEFWAVLMHSLGRPAVRYHPARYYGINLYGLNLIGTIEFRMMNFSTNYNWVVSVLHLLQLITEIAALSYQKLIDPLPITTLTDSREDIVAFLTELNNLGAACESAVMLNGNDIENLLDIIAATPTPEMSTEIVRSHLRDFRYNAGNDGFAGRVIVPADATVESGHLSIHNIDEHDTTILE